MIKTIVIIMLAMPLLSLAPAPAAHTVYWTRPAIQTSAPLVQACSFEIASSRLSQVVNDPAGAPYGFVQAWSCSGDTAAVVSELAQRAGAMQAQATAYRAAHPIGGVR